MEDDIEVVIITGMSGAGKTVAAQCFEDMGYFCVDNMPPALFSKFWELIIKNSSIKKIALVIDLRSNVFFEQVTSFLNFLATKTHQVKIMFLDATDDILVARYKETRRNHPLAPEGRLMDGIARERELLREVRKRSQLVIDTTNLKPNDLRQQIFHNFKEGHEQPFFIEIISFGFKYGIPIDADYVIDLRFIKNPFYVEKLKPLTGLDEPVREYVMEQPETESFYEGFYNLMKQIIPGFKKQGKQNLTIAVGCTGGQHRSVAIAQRLHDDFAKDYSVDITHRDIHKDVRVDSDE
ncbi:RNase adapter RapZ [Xylocopilactobacillus apicola]|uniref:Nucleotide-binding protein n=1 Tax=Xylocopilactobacillus apicola TaxID=2932184 RepID=A0AAU9DQ37_9LACO|nr:RNase adapter RapZ [Xylocopilactobacillus apicola]BDR57964.1 nucleotide-binding protein [Xylocopilactobacillus apicola]